MHASHLLMIPDVPSTEADRHSSRSLTDCWPRRASWALCHWRIAGSGPKPQRALKPTHDPRGGREAMLWGTRWRQSGRLCSSWRNLSGGGMYRSQSRMSQVVSSTSMPTVNWSDEGVCLISFTYFLARRHHGLISYCKSIVMHRQVGSHARSHSLAPYSLRATVKSPIAPRLSHTCARPHRNCRTEPLSATATCTGAGSRLG